MYKKAAEQGNIDAQNSLADCYYDGKGVEKDFTKAFEWFEKAANQGSAYGQYSLGYCYEKGEGINKNKKEAIKWYKKAAEQGEESAIEALDNMN